jgi:hypothetical protein
MKRLLVLIAALVAAVWIPVRGGVAETPLESAALAWDRGDYTSALTIYLQILDSPEAAAALEPIALQTGELYQTTELTSDGSAPIFSPDGRHFAYETGSGVTRRIRVVPANGTTTPVAELNGSGAVFSMDGSKIAYLSLAPVGELITAQAAVDTATPADRPQRQNVLDRLVGELTGIRVTDIGRPGVVTQLETGGMRETSLAFGANAVFFTGFPAEGGPAQVFETVEGRAPIARTTGDTDKVIQKANAQGTALIFTSRPPGTGGRGGGRAGGAGAPATFSVLSLTDGRITVVNGSAPAFSRDGASIAYVRRDGADNQLLIAATNDPANGSVIRKGPERIDAPAFSPNGSRIAFQLMPKDDWEIYVIGREGTGEARVTREIQHDLLPVFLTEDRLLAAMGEPRHRRSYLYALPAMTRVRLFHNNTVRTIAPEYSWTAGPDGSKILIAAERDGDTVSPERGVYLMDLSRRVTRDELRARVRTSLDTEQALVAGGKRMYAPIAADVKRVVADASVHRIYGYEKTLFDFDSKYVTQPGNKRAAAFLFDTYQSFGYRPEYQPFEYRIRNGPTGQTANVVATLTGTVNPELIYVVSSHYDSVAVGPGADDDSSGTAALLETARILAGHPQPATIIFASFTGEEAGLLGSREFVRRAVENKLKVAGALNNDMIGWANDARLDNTIRYSNAGIRDVQHAAAMQFSNLITYDALYYKSTDAAAYYEAYGDIVGGIGSYPVLGNPHYHQSHDLLEGINHQLVTEVSKTTAATLMLLASSPSRVKGLKIDSFTNGVASLSWAQSPEKGVTGYIFAYCTPAKPDAQQVRVVKATATLTRIAPDTIVSVKAINAKGLEGWDWARVKIASQ